MLGWLTIFMICSSRFLNRLSCSTFLMATCSAQTEHGWNHSSTCMQCQQAGSAGPRVGKRLSTFAPISPDMNWPSKQDLHEQDLLEGWES